jgi:hypothetical protein
LRYKLNRFGLAFLNPPTVLRRREYKTGFAFSVYPIREFCNPEAMDVVCGRDLELHSRALLDTDW